MVRVFVVTGSNKGIGKSIVKLLLKDQEEKIVYLTSRNVELGEKAVKELEELNLRPQYHQLDITDNKSIEALCSHLVGKHGGLDVLVNNAGIAYKGSSDAPFSEQAEVTVNCNFFGTLAVCDILFPILKPNARVVHVSSMTSRFAFMKLSDSWKAKFKEEVLTIIDLKRYLESFISDAQNNKVEENGWPMNAYGMSKIGVSFMTILQQRQFDKDQRKIVVNCCCPGLVDTDMTGGRYPNPCTPDEGADTPTYLALLPISDKEPKGSYFFKREIVPYPPLD